MKTLLETRPEGFIVRSSERTAAESHDLPVIGVVENARHLPRWESLLDDGVQPSLILGAERRSHGGR